MIKVRRRESQKKVPVFERKEEFKPMREVRAEKDASWTRFWEPKEKRRK
jgi:hypothetical protein